MLKLNPASNGWVFLLKGIDTNMKSFHEWLNENNQERPTRHRVFNPLVFGKIGENDYIADNPNYAYRITGQSQIDDIKVSGLVRAREGKMRGGRTGETQWSQGAANFKYNPAPNQNQYILVTNASNLNDREGGLPKGDLVQIMYSDGEKWTDVTNQIK